MGSIDESIYYGVYGTKITWDVGWIPVSRLRGSSYYSESWLLRNDVNSSMEKLKEELEELDSQINVCDRQIEESLQEILESQQMDDLKESDINDLKPNNLEDPNVFLENAQNVKIHLEDSMKSLRSATLLFRWDKKSLPPHLHRLDAPWIHLLQIQIQRDLELQNWIQKQWDDSRDRFFRSRGLKPPKRKKTISQAIGTPEGKASEESSKKKGSKSKKDDEGSDKPPQVANDDMRFVAKMIYGQVGVSETGKKFYATKALENARVLRDDATEAEKVMRGQWRYILLYCGGDFQESGLVPLIATTAAKYSHPKYKLRHALALISPYCEHGNGISLVRNISGQRHLYFYTCDLLHYNLLLIIKALAFLESFEIFHGNIKLSNIYVSSTGFILLLGDFMLPLRVKSWFIEIMKKNANVPLNISPELRYALTKPNYKTYEDFEKEVDLYKNDVFCLAMVFLSLSLVYEPVEKDHNRIRRFIKESLMKLAEDPAWSAEYIELLGKMLTVDPKKRPRFQDLLACQDYEVLLGKGFFDQLKQLFLVKPIDEAAEELLQPEDEILHFSKLSDGVVLRENKKNDNTCNYM
ncbi:Ser/Thr protein kinase [Cryptosporidium canis]|uniref:Ser/Thr protein kinase n=1 Tax=Cryptosporidium canis TaxID=195482 RepID=A0A9D5DGW7_9CRYT|nr:Ser/Thr protein kinase [Cryptosporidium canis]